MIPYKYKDIRYGVWMNPNAKSIRHKPIDFGEINVQVEVPKPMLRWQLIIKVIWTSYDAFSSTDTYSKYFIAGGILEITCYQFLPLPKKVESK